MSSATLTWEPSPEDPSISWTRPHPAFGDLYATVTVTSHLARSADYDIEYRVEQWDWTVSDAATGEDLRTGTSPTQRVAHREAEAALREITTHSDA